MFHVKSDKVALAMVREKSKIIIFFFRRREGGIFAYAYGTNVGFSTQIVGTSNIDTFDSTFVLGIVRTLVCTGYDFDIAYEICQYV